MANDFKIKTKADVGDSAATVYTCPASTETTIIGMSVANTSSSSITVDVQIESDTVDTETNANIYIVKAAPIPVGSSLVVIGGDQKVVMQATDVLKVTSSAATSADVALSILEIS